MTALRLVGSEINITDSLYKTCGALGFEPRPSQVEACQEIENFIQNSKQKFMTLMAPCASGKSVIAISTADYISEFYGHGGQTAIVTIANQLIDQYTKDFPTVNTFQGRSHYACSIDAGWDCEMGSEVQKHGPSSCQNACPYRKSQNSCFIEPYTIFNPVSWLYLPKATKEESLGSEKSEINLVYKPKLMIVDEAHELGQFLASLSELIIWEKDISWSPGQSASIPGVLEILENYYESLKQYCIKIIKFSEDTGGEDRSQIKEIVTVRRKMQSINFIITSIKKYPDEFVIEETKDMYHKTEMKCLKVRCLDVSVTILNKFFSAVDKVIFMSGSILDSHMKELKIEKKEYYKFEIASSIDVKNREITVYPSIDCSYKNKDNYPRQIANKIEKIIENHAGERGLISVSYADLERLKPLLTSKRYVFNSKLSKKDDLSSFLKHKEKDDRIAVFAASSVGLDLKDDLCRFIIIPKVKVANWGDVLVQTKARKYREFLWYECTGMIDIIQASARGCRHENDYCKIYILDSNFMKYYIQTKKYLPKYFTDSIRIVRGY